jgi:hypothetical protein
MRQQALLWFIRAGYVFICAMFVLMLGMGSLGFIAIMIGIWWQWEQVVRRHRLDLPPDKRPTAHPLPG